MHNNRTQHTGDAENVNWWHKTKKSDAAQERDKGKARDIENKNPRNIGINEREKKKKRINNTLIYTLNASWPHPQDADNFVTKKQKNNEKKNTVINTYK